VSTQPRSDGGPLDLTVRQAVERWLDHLRLDKTDQTVAGYQGRLKHFVEWCEDEGYESLQELDGWEIDSYETHRRSNDIAPITLKNELITLRQFFEYAARLGLASESFPEKIHLPDVSRDEKIDKTLLPEEAATALSETYRDGGRDQHHRTHAFLALAWFTGARLGGLRGLDLDDVHLEAGYVEFHHRSEEGTHSKTASTVSGWSASATRSPTHCRATSTSTVRA
jgi:site-specific recombinase XerD